MTERVSVGVIDSGWRGPDPGSHLQRGRSFCSAVDPFTPMFGSDDFDRLGHGTLCSQIIIALAPLALLTPLRIFHRRLETSPKVLLAALDWAITQNFDVLNLSLSTTREDACDALYRRCHQLKQAGTTIVCAAANNSQAGYPAIFDNVLGVALDGPVADGRPRPLDGPAAELLLSFDWFDRPLERGRHMSIRSTSQASAVVAGLTATHIQQHGRLPIDLMRRGVLTRLVELGADSPLQRPLDPESPGS